MIKTAYDKGLVARLRGNGQFQFEIREWNRANERIKDGPALPDEPGEAYSTQTRREIDLFNDAILSQAAAAGWFAVNIYEDPLADLDFLVYDKHTELMRELKISKAMGDNIFEARAVQLAFRESGLGDKKNTLNEQEKQKVLEKLVDILYDSGYIKDKNEDKLAFAETILAENDSSATINPKYRISVDPEAKPISSKNYYKGLSQIKKIRKAIMEEKNMDIKKVENAEVLAIAALYQTAEKKLKETLTRGYEAFGITNAREYQGRNVFYPEENVREVEIDGVVYRIEKIVADQERVIDAYNYLLDRLADSVLKAYGKDVTPERLKEILPEMSDADYKHMTETMQKLNDSKSGFKVENPYIFGVRLYERECFANIAHLSVKPDTSRKKLIYKVDDNVYEWQPVEIDGASTEEDRKAVEDYNAYVSSRIEMQSQGIVEQEQAVVNRAVDPESVAVGEITGRKKKVKNIPEPNFPLSEDPHIPAYYQAQYNPASKLAVAFGAADDYFILTKSEYETLVNSFFRNGPVPSEATIYQFIAGHNERYHSSGTVQIRRFLNSGSVQKPNYEADLQDPENAVYIITNKGRGAFVPVLAKFDREKTTGVLDGVINADVAKGLVSFLVKYKEDHKGAKFNNPAKVEVAYIEKLAADATAQLRNTIEIIKKQSDKYPPEEIDGAVQNCEKYIQLINNNVSEIKNNFEREDGAPGL